jgi:hypothetical protein
MSELVPCPTCRRHCRGDAPCPFCGAALPPTAARSPGAASGRLSRAAIFAGAAFVAPACGSASSHPASAESTPSNTVTDSRGSTGRLSGTVTNMRTRLPAPGEAIWIRTAPSEHPSKHPFERSVTTNDDGTYVFDDLPPGEYVVVFPTMRRRDDDNDRGTRVTIKRGEAAVLDRAIVVYDPSDAKMPYGAPPVRRRVV